MTDVILREVEENSHFNPGKLPESDLSFPDPDCLWTMLIRRRGKYFFQSRTGRWMFW